MRWSIALSLPAAVALAGFVAGTGAVAQDDTAAQDDAGVERPSETFFPEQRQSELRAHELIGLSVVNADGDTVGSVNDVVIADGMGIKAVVIGIGGLFGIGEKEVAVNYDRLEEQRNEDGSLQLTLGTEVEELADAPEFVTFEARRQAEMEAELEAERQQQMQQSPSTGAGTGGAGMSGAGTGGASGGAGTGLGTGQ